MATEVVVGLVAALPRVALVMAYVPVIRAAQPMSLAAQLRILAVLPAINALPAPIMTARSVIDGAGFR